MFIHRNKEGDILKNGISWRSDEHTLISLKFLIPLYIILPKKHYDFLMDCFYYGWQIKKIYFAIRIRRWKNFSSKVKKVTFHFNSNIRPFGKQQLVATREMLEDAKCQ